MVNLYCAQCQQENSTESEVQAMARYQSGCHTRQCPDYLSSSVQACSSDPARIRLRSATSINYSVPRTKTKFGDRAFSVAGPVVWNSIPAAVREADTVSSFKRKLKTHSFFLCASTMFDFDFCNAFPVRARVGSGTITAIYHYYYYYYCVKRV